jgi:hypothetical protein
MGNSRPGNGGGPIRKSMERYKSSPYWSLKFRVQQEDKPCLKVNPLRSLVVMVSVVVQ